MLQGKIYRDQEAMVKKGTRILDTMRKTKAGTPSDLIFNLIYYFGSWVESEFLGNKNGNIGLTKKFI